MIFIMEIDVNGVKQTIHENSTVTELMTQLDLPAIGVAVAVNQQVISKVKWDETKLIAGDEVIVIKATCGG